MSGLTQRGLIAIFSMAAVATAAHGTVIYGGGGSYSVDTAIHDNVEIVEGSHVVLTTGAQVVGVDRPTHYAYPGAVSVRNGSIDLTGNSHVAGGTGPYAINGNHFDAIIRLRDDSRVTGHIFNDTTRGPRTETSRVRLHVSDRALVDGNIEFGGYIRIEDQAHILGNVRNSETGSFTLDMRGGTVDGTLHMHGINGYDFNLSGGSILGGVDAHNAWTVDLDMRGGEIQNGFRVTSWAGVRGEIKGGSIDGGLLINTGSGYTPSSDLTLSGGRFDAALGNWLMNYSDTNTLGNYSSLSVWGGEFGYSQAGLGFRFDNLVNVDFYGRDLQYTDGWLTGWLHDGSWFNNQLIFGDGWSGRFTLHNVPEPGTFGLIALSLAGMWLARRRRRDDAPCRG